MQKKLKFIVFEGVDGTGKSVMTKMLTDRSEKFVKVDFLWNTDNIVFLDPVEKMPLLLNTFQYYDPTKIYILDRFILSDIVYNAVIRNQDISEYSLNLRKFIEKYDVLFVLLDRENVTEDFSDSKIKVSTDKFNQLIDRYRNLDILPAYSWSRQIVENGKLIYGASNSLHNDIKFCYENDGISLQAHLAASDPWKFFLGCIALNRTTGKMARRVMSEFFSHFPDRNCIKEDLNAKMAEILRPLGLHHNRAETIIRFTEHFKKIGYNRGYIFSRKEIENCPGLGKFAADSWMVFCKRDFNSLHYSEPLDKVVKARLLEA